MGFFLFFLSTWIFSLLRVSCIMFCLLSSAPRQFMCVQHCRHRAAKTKILTIEFYHSAALCLGWVLSLGPVCIKLQLTFLHKYGSNDCKRGHAFRLTEGDQEEETTTSYKQWLLLKRLTWTLLIWIAFSHQ